VAQPLNFPNKHLDAYMLEETGLDPATGPSHHELCDKFFLGKRAQFLTLMVYLIPLDSVQEILANEYPGLLSAMNEKGASRIHSKGIVGSEEITGDIAEADKFIDSWRTVARLYARYGDSMRKASGIH
jgi:hypothetical protein